MPIASTGAVPLTARAVLLGTVLALANCWLIILSDNYGRDSGTALPLFTTPVAMLFGLTLLQQTLPARFRLRPSELITVYLLPVIATALAGHDMLQNFFGVVTHATWGATEANDWTHLFGNRLPAGLVVSDPVALDGFYQGAQSIYEPRHYRPWLPVLWHWGIFCWMLMLAFACLAVLVRRRWSEDERLSFPIIQLPHALAEPAPLLRDRLMWLGFTVAFSLKVLRLLHSHVPAVPLPPEWLGGIWRFDTQLTTAPWTGLGPSWVGVQWFAVGLAYFVPQDLILSCWVFYVLRKLSEVGATALLGSSRQSFPYVNEQACGAWIMLGALALGSARVDLRRAGGDLARLRFRRAAGDPMPLGLALLGLLAAAAYFAWFSRRWGLTLAPAAAFFAVYFLLALAISRVRVELGTPHEIYFVNPLRAMITVVGSEALGPRNLNLLSLYYWFNRCYRPHPMPNLLEGFKLADQTGLRPTGLVPLLLWASLLGIAGTFWAQLHLSYRDGAAARMISFSRWGGLETWLWLANWLNNPQPVETPRVTALLAGGGLVAGLRLLRTRFIAWPLHPAGYALAISYAMEYYWSTFLFTWLLKGYLNRAGGMAWHRRAVPAALGLILGDYLGQALRLVIDPWLM